MKTSTNRYGNKYQKTTLADGFIASVVGKLTLVPQAELILIYHKRIKMSNNIKKCLRGPDGSRTRSFCLRGSWSTISLPAQLTEAELFSQELTLKVNHL